MHATRRIQRRRDVALQRFETARRPHHRLTGFRTERQAGADGEDFGAKAKQRVGAVGHERADGVPLAFVHQDIDLVDDDDDLLAPGADLLEEGALGFGERPVCRGDEDHQVRTGHELGGDGLVLADDCVGAWRIDDVDLLKQGDGRGNDMKVRLAHLPVHRLSILQNVDLRRCRSHPFGDDTAADEAR